MNTKLTILLILAALALTAYNITLVNWTAPFTGDSTVAIIGVVACLSAIVLLLIYNTSKKIADKVKK